jgi:hypothetical protein
MILRILKHLPKRIVLPLGRSVNIKVLVNWIELKAVILVALKKV